MKIKTVPIDSISLDPANIRKHSDSQIEQLKASLKRFGQQRPIIIDSRNVVRAGNGTMAAAKALGWTSIKAIVSDLVGSELTAFAIADNRLSDLSEFDDEALAIQLKSIQTDGLELDGLGFDDKELEKLLAEESAADGVAVEKLADETFLVLITAKDEADQARLLEKFTKQGLDCRALNQ